jgi:ribosomal protein S18 acetylase RimI-like enzyme
MKEIIFCKLKAEDLSAYKTIRLECLENYPQNFGTLYKEEIKATKFKFDDIIAKPPGIDFLMGEFDGGKLIGICGFIQEKRLRTRYVGEISQMYVKPAYAGKGIGAGLLQATIAVAFANAEIKKIILAVAVINTAAQKLYLKNNFTQYGKLENYFDDSVGASARLFMELNK